VNCLKANRLLLAKRDGAERALHAHLASCSACRQLQALLLDLAVVGDTARMADLSQRVLVDTRHKAAEALEARRGAAATSHTPTFGLRAAAVCAAVMLLAGAVLVSFRGERLVRGNRPGISVPAVAAAPAPLALEIAQQRRSVSTGLRTFEENYLPKSRRSRFEARADVLRSRIQLCAFELESELESAEPHGGGEGRLPEEDRGDGSEERKSSDEDVRDRRVQTRILSGRVC